MEVIVLNYFPERKGSSIGFIDVKVIYTEEKWEVFRNLNLWTSKNGKVFVSFGNVKRDEKWLPRYERNPMPKELFSEILKAYDAYVTKHSLSRN